MFRRIESIKTRDVTIYHLSSGAHAAKIIDDLARPELKIKFDRYHMQIMQGNLARALERLMSLFGHIPIAAVPDRDAPDRGEVDFIWLFGELTALGYQGFIGAEHQPGDKTETGLRWMAHLKSG